MSHTGPVCREATHAVRPTALELIKNNNAGDINVESETAKLMTCKVARNKS